MPPAIIGLDVVALVLLSVLIGRVRRIDRPTRVPIAPHAGPAGCRPVVASLAIMAAGTLAFLLVVEILKAALGR